MSGRRHNREPDERDEMGWRRDGLLPCIINPATILIRDHEDLVVSGGTPIVTGSGAIPCQA
jgi:hypothetical protein